MSDEKKPKIDLKARLGKMGVGGQTPPPAGSAGNVPAPTGSIPAPIPTAPGSIPAAVPPPPGVAPSSPFAPTPTVDPSNPIMAAVARSIAPTAPAAPPQPQRIEIDEGAIQEARAKARNQAMIAGLVLAVLFAGVGYAAGGAAEQGAGRKKGESDAAALAVDVGTARDKMKQVADKLEAGNKALRERKFPDTLASELGALNVDFDGSKLAGRRFSGFSLAASGGLIEFVTSVQTLKDKTALVSSLLSRLQKPLTEQFSAPAGQVNVRYVVAISPDPAGNASAILGPLTTPVAFTAQKVEFPDKFTFMSLSDQKTELPRYKGGDLSRTPAAIYVAPKSFDKVCPNETAGQVAQLGAQIGNLVRDIRGESGPAPTDAVVEPKPGLVERADKLIAELQKVGK
ncbi:MAG: hypothetical protein U0169_27145 [Polyangiaceae bacterium]